ncbi:hypothetical protein LZZ85_01500 [Terrimonas sp. NA20]|uniref:Uncharacterized protein n=1 Tax=Terrimonas ginsenosidimutans TaxID=2908004 RepID=A0ABS9KKU5_9BACT|nr:hypothetical protein [Terrimonas ginsenosidimutans]MCG2612926.1 hypothetical protein [Terrimonas ginsenosidimutans]
MSGTVAAQKKKFYFPGWTYHKRNAVILGVSGGLWSSMDSARKTTSIGLKLEAPGVGLLAAFVPSSPVSETDSAFQVFKKKVVSEKVYGLSVSLTGTACNCTVNGVSVGGIAQIQGRVNGISFSPISFTEVHNGIQLSIFSQTYKMNGIQIGFMNKSSRTRGIQLGLWNRNEKRSLPILNWNFSD